MIFLTAFLLLTGANEPTKNLLHEEKIEIRVGSAIITTTDLKMMEDELRAQNPTGDTAKLEKLARDESIKRALKAIYLEKMGFPVTDKDVDFRVDQHLKMIRSKFPNEAEYNAFLQQKGWSYDKLRAIARLQLEEHQFGAMMRRNVSRTIEEKDLKAFFNNNPDQFKKNFEVELAECLIPYGSDIKDAEKKAEAFVNQPKKFGECVSQVSQSPSAARGGKIGVFTWGILPEEIESKVANLKVGEIAVVKQPQGIQLLKVEKAKAKGPVTFEVAHERIRERLEGELLEKEMEKALSELRADTFIKIES